MKNNTTTLVQENWFRTDIYEVVDDFPNGYMIWPIGRGNFPFEGYIPLCRPDGVTPHTINVTTLKALYVGSEEFALKLLDLAIFGTVGKIYKGKFEEIRMCWGPMI